MNRFSTSFSSDEIQALYSFITKATQNSDIRMVMRSESFRSSLKKIYSMKNRVDEVERSSQLKFQKLCGTDTPVDSVQNTQG